ncbi:MAG TPA: NYN domain-containing protein [Desulfobacterales bacterium]|nr:NYN domain-containing protein [Desulfobacterales bacterium]
MSIHIIIDGYNLIRQSSVFSALDREDIQRGREALIDALAVYRKMKQHKITVVFDGINAPAFSPNKDRIKGISIRFSRNGETADTVIKKMTVVEKEKALVVSSDRQVLHFAACQGCAIIESPVFEEKMATAGYKNLTGFDDETGWMPTTKKKGPAKRLSKRKRRDRIKIKKL